MKYSKLLRIPLSVITLFAAVAAFAAPYTTASNRSAATGNMFKQEYDRLSDNPAYVGAKLGNIEYQNSITKERTNIFTNLNGIASGGRLTLGGTTGFGLLGIGGWVDLRTSKTEPYHNWTGFGAPLLPSTAGYGIIENSDVVFTGANGVYTNRDSAFTEQELYSSDSNVDAKIAVGGFKVGPLVLGLSLERDSDGSSSQDGAGEYSYSAERLADDYVSRTYDASYDYDYDTSINRWLINIGGFMPMSGVLEAIEFDLGIGLNFHSIESANNGTIEDVLTGSTTVTYTGDVQGNTAVDLKDDRMTLDTGLTVATREKILDWSALTYIHVNASFFNPQAGLDATYRPWADNYSYAYSGNENRINEQSLEIERKRENDSSLGLDFGAGFAARRDLTKDLSMGFGFSWFMSTAEYTFFENLTLTEIETVNNGDLLNTADDFTRTSTFSKKNKHTIEIMTHSFTIPVGLEYRATENLSWRLGFIHTTSLYSYLNRWVNDSVSDLYNDYDRLDIEGNETNDDGIDNANMSSLVVAGITLDPTQKSSKTVNDTTSQSNSYSFGIGYAIENTVQIDFLFVGSTANVINSSSAYVSATLVLGKEGGSSAEAPKSPAVKRR